MSWAAIIAMLIQVLLPYILDWIKEWLANRAARVAATVRPAESFASPKEATIALLDAVIADTPRLAFARRSLLRWLKNLIASRGEELMNGTLTLSDDEAATLRDLASCVDNE